MAGNHEGLVLDQRYRVEQLLRDGGMGSVYLGRHIDLGKKVAIKFVHSDFARNEKVLKRFKREAQMMAELRHENIVDVLDIGVTQEGEPYLVMEYLEGESLGDLVKRSAPLSLETTCSILVPALRALVAAHEHGVVHRDLKPDNIFLVKHEGEVPVVKIIDFGVSKLFSKAEDTDAIEKGQLTETGAVLGTPAYMSPEQARGVNWLDHRADLYSMGVLLYEMLTGKTPYEGKSPTEILVRLLTEPPRSPFDAYADFPVCAGPIVDKAMAKDPGDRYQSALEMIQGLDQIVPLASRIAHLTQYGATILTLAAATGDVGKTIGNESSDTVLSEPLGDRTGNGQDSNRGVDATWASDASMTLKGLAEAATVTMRRRPKLLTGIGAAVFTLLLLFSIRACIFPGQTASANDVLIAVEGAPADSQIYYNGALMPENPFRVKKEMEVSSIRVLSEGYAPLTIPVIPSSDKTVYARMASTSEREQPREATKSIGTSPEEQASGDLGYEPTKKGKGAKKKHKKKHKSKEFLYNIRQAF